MSERTSEEEEAGPSFQNQQDEGDQGLDHSMMIASYEPNYESRQNILQDQEPIAVGIPGTSSNQHQPSYPVPPTSLKVKRPGRPRIHPPKPVGISKPRGRPRGSKNKKPRKRRDPSTLAERPPKRPRGRPRKWPPEMWEGFQRSQFAAATQHMQQMQRQQQEQQHVSAAEMMPGPSHLFYEEHVPPPLSHPDEVPSTVPPPLSHLPFHLMSQHETQDLTHLMPMSLPPQMSQQQQPPPQSLQLHRSIHPPPQHHTMQRQEDQMLLIRPLYLQEQERHLRDHEMMLSQEEQQRRFYHEQLHHPPHTTS